LFFFVVVLLFLLLLVVMVILIDSCSCFWCQFLSLVVVAISWLIVALFLVATLPLLVVILHPAVVSANINTIIPTPSPMLNDCPATEN